MNFAKRLEEVGRDAPAGYCRDELNRLVNNIRSLHAVSDEEKKKRILHSIETGAREAEEIADDCRFSLRETTRLIRVLTKEKRIEKKSRGGVMNRGRRMKFNYFLAAGFI